MRASSALVQGAKKETEQPSHATDAHSPRPTLQQPSSALGILTLPPSLPASLPHPKGEKKQFEPLECLLVTLFHLAVMVVFWANCVHQAYILATT
jgi:hypothetical protein